MASITPLSFTEKVASEEKTRNSHSSNNLHLVIRSQSFEGTSLNHRATEAEQNEQSTRVRRAVSETKERSDTNSSFPEYAPEQKHKHSHLSLQKKQRSELAEEKEPAPSLQHQKKSLDEEKEVLPLVLSSSEETKVALLVDIGTFIDGLKQKLANNCLSLDEGTLALTRLQSLYREKSILNESQLAQIVSLGNQVEGIVQAKNNASASLTRRDLQMLGSFFEPPLDQFYIDDSGKKYVLADNSTLLRMATFYWGKYSAYKGLEVSKLKKALIDSKSSLSITGSSSLYYDAIFFKKFPEQNKGYISRAKDYIVDKAKSLFDSEEKTEIQKIENKQEKMLQELKEYFNQEYRKLGYGGFCILRTEADFVTIGLSSQSGQEYHGIIFFLNHVSSPNF